MTTLTCLDLDRTLIFSPAALALAMPDAEAPRLLCVEVYRGVPLSFITDRSADLLRELTSLSIVVPTTTRTPEQLGRVQLAELSRPALKGLQQPRYAIASNGGHLLIDGVPDPDWDVMVKAALSECAPLAVVHHHVQARSGDFVQTLRTAGELFGYCVVDRAALPATWVDELTQFCATVGWGVSVQGRKVYFVPRPLTKSAAMLEVARRIGASTCLAAGDSLLDRELLEAADLAVRPAAGELADLGWTAPHVQHLTIAGVLGGEELLSLLVRWHRQVPY